MASCHHSRSHSMPSELHPLVTRIEEELSRLELIPTAYSSIDQAVCTALARLQQLHSCVEKLLSSPLVQQAFARRRHEKWLTEELDGSIRLLDLLGTARELLSAMKEQVRDLQLVLRRRGDQNVGKSIVVYLQFRRKAQRDVNKCLVALKGMDSKCGYTAPLDQDCKLPILARLLSQVRATTVTLICSVLSPVTKTRSPASTGRCSLVPIRTTGRGRNAVAPEDVHEGESADAVLSAFCRRVSTKDADGEEIARVQKLLEMMEAGIEGVTSGLECLFRQLIQNRVTLLNILS